MIVGLIEGKGNRIPLRIGFSGGNGVVIGVLGVILPYAGVAVDIAGLQITRVLANVQEV